MSTGLYCLGTERVKLFSDAMYCIDAISASLYCLREERVKLFCDAKYCIDAMYGIDAMPTVYTVYRKKELNSLMMRCTALMRCPPCILST